MKARLTSAQQWALYYGTFGYASSDGYFIESGETARLSTLRKLVSLGLFKIFSEGCFALTEEGKTLGMKLRSKLMPELWGTMGGEETDDDPSQG